MSSGNPSIYTSISSFLSQVFGCGDSWSKIDLDSSKEAIAKGWNKSLQEMIDKCFDAFKPRLRRAIEV